MLIGLLIGWLRARLASQSASRHSWVDGPVTTEAVLGGISVARAIGSAFSCQLPSGPSMRNL
jgi:NhaP-type Na+/H+ or K+/H+ antiporter